jgi:hypothetical protein
VTSARLAPVAALCLVASGLAAAFTSGPASALPPDTFQERWCTDEPAPCLLSASRNGVALTAADPVISVEMIGVANNPDFKYTAFLVRSTSGVLDVTDTYSLTFDLGNKVVPDYTGSSMRTRGPTKSLAPAIQPLPRPRWSWSLASG